MPRNRMNYESWFREVDRMIMNKYFLGANDAADWPSADAYASGKTPAQAVKIWLKYQDLGPYA